MVIHKDKESMAAWYKLRKDMEAAGVKSIARHLLEQDGHRSRVFAGEASSVLAACRGSIAASSSGSAAASSEGQKLEAVAKKHERKLTKLEHIKYTIRERQDTEERQRPWGGIPKARPKPRPTKQALPSDLPATACKAKAAPKQAASCNADATKKKKGGVKRIGERIKRLEAEGTPEALAQAVNDRWLRSGSSKKRKKRRQEVKQTLMNDVRGVEERST